MVDTKNRYPGINPHLNSLLQSPGGGWEMFHPAFLMRLLDELESRLPENYLPFAEKSLQITLIDPQTDTPLGRLGTRRPDVIVMRKGEGIAQTSGETVSSPTLALSILDNFDEEETLLGLVIYRLDKGKLPGIPVTRFELLSPGNKPGGAHHAQYLRNRQETLLVGLRLVEIDWLHESRPIIPAIPSYPDGEDDSYAYSIIVSDPRPSLDEGKTLVYGFTVEQPAPTINIPLDGEDFVTLDFGRVYNQTIERRNYYSLIDYTQEPARSQAYSEKDRAYIRQRMAEVNAAP
jgi:Protein of unknown function (DUF4058)